MAAKLHNGKPLILHPSGYTDSMRTAAFTTTIVCQEFGGGSLFAGADCIELNDAAWEDDVTLSEHDELFVLSVSPSIFDDAAVLARAA